MAENINRRDWLKTTGTFAAAMMISDMILGATSKKNPTILLVSG